MYKIYKNRSGDQLLFRAIPGGYVVRLAMKLGEGDWRVCSRKKKIPEHGLEHLYFERDLTDNEAKTEFPFLKAD